MHRLRWSLPRRGDAMGPPPAPRSRRRREPDRAAVQGRVMEEIAKCDLVCANCHAMRTVSRRGSGRSSAWLERRVWDAEVRRFESGRPDYALGHDRGHGSERRRGRAGGPRARRAGAAAAAGRARRRAGAASSAPRSPSPPTATAPRCARRSRERRPSTWCRARSPRTASQEHFSAVDAAAAAGVRRIVYVSFMGAAPDCVFTFARDHAATEERIRSTGPRPRRSCARACTRSTCRSSRRPRA